MNYPGTRYTKQMMRRSVIRQWKKWRRNCGCAARRGAKKPAAGRGTTVGASGFVVHMGEEQNFVYQIWPQQYSCRALPTAHVAGNRPTTGWKPPVRRQPGQRPDGLQQRAGDPDILDQYERHLNFIHLHREARAIA